MLYKVGYFHEGGAFCIRFVFKSYSFRECEDFIKNASFKISLFVFDELGNICTEEALDALEAA